MHGPQANARSFVRNCTKLGTFGGAISSSKDKEIRSLRNMVTSSG